MNNIEKCNPTMNLGKITFIDGAMEYILYYYPMGNDSEIVVKTADNKTYIVSLNNTYDIETVNDISYINMKCKRCLTPYLSAYRVFDEGYYEWAPIKLIELKTISNISLPLTR